MSALGGTLLPGPASDQPAPLVHDQGIGDSPRPRTEPHHPVTVRPGSCLADVLGAETVKVNSMHHQGIKALAPSLAPVAHAPDGLVEGVEPADVARWSFLLGVQWHPEELARAATCRPDGSSSASSRPPRSALAARPGVSARLKNPTTVGRVSPRLRAPPRCALRGQGHARHHWRQWCRSVTEPKPSGRVLSKASSFAPPSGRRSHEQQVGDAHRPRRVERGGSLSGDGWVRYGRLGQTHRAIGRVRPRPPAQLSRESG